MMKVHWTVIALLTLAVSVTLGQDTEPFILFTKRAIIHRVGLDGSDLTDVRNTSKGNVLGLDFDYRERVMFWTEGISTMSIMRGSIDGSIDGTNAETLLTGLGTAEGLAWDWVSRKIYWTDTENKTIEVLDPDTGYHKTLIKTGEGSKPRAIVVDPLEGYVMVCVRLRMAMVRNEGVLLSLYVADRINFSWIETFGPLNEKFILSATYKLNNNPSFLNYGRSNEPILFHGNGDDGLLVLNIRILAGKFHIQILTKSPYCSLKENT